MNSRGGGSMDRDCTNGQRLTAEDMGGDAAPYVEALVQLANERQRYTPGVYGPRREPLPEKEAVARAVEAVREVRRELWGDRNRRVLSPPLRTLRSGNEAGKIGVSGRGTREPVKK